MMEINLSSDEDERALLRLKDQMSDQQRQDMAEIIQNELQRRESMAQAGGSGSSAASLGNAGYGANGRGKSKVPSARLSGGLGNDDLADVYKDSDKKIQELRVRALESRLNEAKKEVSKLGKIGARMPRSSQKETAFLPKGGKVTAGLPLMIIVTALITLGVLKFTKGGFSNPLEANSTANAASSPAGRASLSSVDPSLGSGSITGDLPTESSAEVAASTNGGSGLRGVSFSSPAEKNMLLQLDQRRVELEQRKQILDDKERELQAQAQLVAEKVTELKALVAKLGTLRKDKDHKYEARMEQLASVYSAMAPNEAGSLISKLDDEVGLGLLERMPGKRMAQILGVMDQNRALELTKSLTSRKKL